MTFYVVGFIECEYCRTSDELTSGALPARFEDGILTPMKTLGDEATEMGYKFIKFTDPDGSDNEGWICPECQELFNEGH